MHAVFRYPQESRSTHIKGGAFYLFLVFFFFFFFQVKSEDHPRFKF
jgi:hypothetical protein